MINIDKEISLLDEKINKLNIKKQNAIKFNNAFNLLKDKYKDLQIKTNTSNYVLVADLKNSKDKKAFVIITNFFYTKTIKIFYYFKTKDKDTNSFIYDNSYFDLQNCSNNYCQLIFVCKQAKTINIEQDYLEILANNKQAIKKIQDFFIEKSKNYKIINNTNNPKIQQFIDNLIFI